MDPSLNKYNLALNRYKSIAADVNGLISYTTFIGLEYRPYKSIAADVNGPIP